MAIINNSINNTSDGLTVKGVCNINTISVDVATSIGNTTGVSTLTLSYGSGGLIISPFASYGALVTNTSGLITDAASTAGYVLTGNSGAAPTFQAVTAIGVVTSINGNSGTATPSSGVVTISGSGVISTSGSSATLTVTSSAANVIHSGSGDATASSNAFTVTGTGPISTSATGSTVTIATTAANSFATGSGTATASSNSITIAGGTGITTSGSGSTVTITASGGGGGITWVDQTSGSVNLAASHGYVIDNGASLVTLTLPSTAALGDTYQITGFSSGGWSIAEQSGQSIHFGNVTTTTTTGTLASTNQYDQVTITCVVANTTFVVTTSLGNLSYT